MSAYAVGAGDLVPDDRDSAPVLPKGIVTGEATGPDPTANRPGHSLENLVIYEAHVKGLTAAHPEVPEELRGTYAGMAHPVIIDHLQRLGVNAVELLPLQTFLDDEFLVGRGSVTTGDTSPSRGSPRSPGMRSRMPRPNSGTWCIVCTKQVSKSSWMWSTTTPARAMSWAPH